MVAAGCLALGYLGISLMVMPDVAPRGAALAEVPIVDLVGSQCYLRFWCGAHPRRRGCRTDRRGAADAVRSQSG